MDESLKNAFGNILISAGGVVEYLSKLKSKNLIVPNNRLDKNNNPKYNGLIATLNTNINLYNAVLDEFVINFNDTEQALKNLKEKWEVEDANAAKVKTEASSVQAQSQQLQQERQQPIKQEAQQQQGQDADIGVKNELANFDGDAQMDIDNDAYLSQFLQPDVDESGLDTNGLLDFENAEISNNDNDNKNTNNAPDQQQQQAVGTANKNTTAPNYTDIDGNKNPADILYGTSKTPSTKGTEATDQQMMPNNFDDNNNDNNNMLGVNAVSKMANTNNNGMNDDINLDDLEELLASTNDGNDSMAYDANGVPIDDNNIFDELNYFLGGNDE